MKNTVMIVFNCFSQIHLSERLIALSTMVISLPKRMLILSKRMGRGHLEQDIVSRPFVMLITPDR